MATTKKWYADADTKGMCTETNMPHHTYFFLFGVVRGREGVLKLMTGHSVHYRALSDIF